MSCMEIDVTLTAVLDTLVDGAIIIDEHGGILAINPSASVMFGYTAEDVLGKNVSLLMPTPYKTEHDTYLKSYRKTGKKKIIGIGREVEGQKSCGESFPMDLAVGEVTAGEQNYYIGIIRDLTEAKKEQQAFETLQLKHFYMSRAAAMNEMGSAIAHELNQPLAAITNYLETIRFLLDRNANCDMNKIHDVINKAIEQTHRTSAVVDKLRHQLSNHNLPKQNIDLSQELPMALNIALSHINKKNLVVTTSYPPNLPHIFGNQSQIQMVIIQLIRNACDVLQDRDDAKIEISIKHDIIQNEVCVSISDNGPGLTKDNIDSLFVPLADKTQNGMGTGLSICHSIITAHNGRIWAESNKPNGTIFVCTIPLEHEDNGS